MPTTDQTKPFKSYDEQIALLRERGLIITDDVYARDVLKRMNYYRFSAYSLTLRENDRFFPEVTLQDMTSMMLELILIAALGVILEWLAQANQSIGVQLHKLPSRNYDFDQLWMKLFLNPVMSIC